MVIKFGRLPTFKELGKDMSKQRKRSTSADVNRTIKTYAADTPFVFAFEGSRFNLKGKVEYNLRSQARVTGTSSQSNHIVAIRRRYPNFGWVKCDSGANNGGSRHTTLRKDEITNSTSTVLALYCANFGDQTAKTIPSLLSAVRKIPNDPGRPSIRVAGLFSRMLGVFGYDRKHSMKVTSGVGDSPRKRCSRVVSSGLTESDSVCSSDDNSHPGRGLETRLPSTEIAMPPLVETDKLGHTGPEQNETHFV